jgi:hypothetical protein
MYKRKEFLRKDAKKRSEEWTSIVLMFMHKPWDTSGCSLSLPCYYYGHFGWLH